MSGESAVHKGSCYCGAVQVTVEGPPAGAGLAFQPGALPINTGPPSVPSGLMLRIYKYLWLQSDP